MKRTKSLAALLVALIAIAPSIASAQVRTGVPIDSLRTALAALGLEIRDVSVPGHVALPVRLTLAHARTSEAPGTAARTETVALLDVRVAESAGDASAWIDEHATTATTRGLVVVARGTYADRAEGRASVALLAEDNVAIAVRLVDVDVAEVDAQGQMQLDALAIARAVCGAVRSAPEGPPRAAALRAPDVPRDLAVGASHPVQVPSELLAVRVSATGDAYARRTPRGWMITRTGDGVFTIAITGVDALLRVR